MGAQQSKDALLYEQVGYGNVEGIRALRRDGAGLEWIDKEGRTPLIVASMRPELLEVVRVLIELGANVNSYRPGSHAGTPLHHAAKRGLTQTVELLLSHRANPLAMNDDCQTALDLARTKGHWNVVRLIETHICLFAGWLRETYGPSILAAIVRQWVIKKVWAVILPCGSRNSTNQPQYELAVYSDLQAAQPTTVIQLWKANVEAPVFNLADPALVITDKTTQKRYKFLSGDEGDKQQLQVVYNACSGIPQRNYFNQAAPALAPMPNAPPLNPYASTTPSGVPLPDARPTTGSSDFNGWGTSSGDATHNGWGPPDVAPPTEVSGQPLTDAQQNTANSNLNGWGTSSVDATQNGWAPPEGAAPSKASTQTQFNEPAVDPYNGWDAPEARRTEVRPSVPAPQFKVHEPGTSAVSSSIENIPPVASAPSAVSSSIENIPPVASAPSAPPVTEEIFYGPVLYPSIDSSPVDIAVPAWEDKPATSELKENNNNSGSCVVCLDAPAEGACIPCGHVAGCMSCLKEIKAKKWGCPVCRAKIDQVIKIYAV